jgi:exodeoxyribonuclease V gamma subunit
MLNINTGSDLHQLADSLADEFNTQLRQNPLSPEWFVVQNHGMAHWLSLYMAEREGIAANLEFKFPAELFWHLLRVMEPDIPENLPSERLPMSWSIFQILTNDTDSSLAELHRYASHPEPQKQEMRRWKLSGRIGDVFDQYLTYRPQMLLAWENGNLSTGRNDEKWQASLWRKLVSHWQGGENSGSGNHRAVLQKQLLRAIDEKNLSGEQLPQRLSIFGVSEMPPAYLKVFLKLSKCTDVHFYKVDISGHSGSSDHSSAESAGPSLHRPTTNSSTGSNPLLESMGQAGREFGQLIDEALTKDHAISANWERLKAWPEKHGAKPGDVTPPPKGNASFFSTLKSDLVSGAKTDTARADRSVHVHSCHSPRREVEVLYDQLLDLLNEDHSLNPSDILVLSPQMETYAPEIEAVFGSAEDNMPEIPYHLSEADGSENAVDLGFRKLLHIADSRFKITDVLDLLDCKPVRLAFLFTIDDISTLERWMEDTRIRWGIDDEHKGSLGLPESGRFTWQSGLHRMVSGYAMEPEDDRLFSGIYPYDEIQQSEQGELLGRFSNFLHLLFECHDEIRKPKRPQEWRELLNEWASAFFTKEEPFGKPLQWLRDGINAMGDQSAGARFTGQVSFRIICTILEDGLDAKRTGGGRSGAGVTFGSMVAMRNIPAKVIGLIGMDDGVFPRTKTGVAFDLITKNPTKGDRSPGKDDRQLFLEALMAAGEQIYFSYVGQSNQKEIDFPPSVILREFIDYLVSQYGVDEKELIQHHRLHLFSPYYFNKNLNDTLFSYSNKSCTVAQQLSQPAAGDAAFVTGSLPEPDLSYKNVSVGELIAFFQHPARYMLQQRMGIQLYTDKVLDEDREMFSLDALGKYTMGQELLDRFLGGESLEKYQKAARAQNLLPDGWPGQQAFDRQKQEVREFGALIQQELAQQKLEPIDVNEEVGEFNIAGRLDPIYKNEQLLYRFGSMRAKDVIELWIRHLAFQIAKPAGHPGRSRLCARDKKKTLVAFRLPAISNAEEILSNLLKVYWTGLQENTYFFPNSSFAYAQHKLQKGKDEAGALRAAEREWVDTYRGYPKEGDDPYNIRLKGNSNPMENSQMNNLFIKKSMFFWKPFFHLLNEENTINRGL